MKKRGVKRNLDDSLNAAATSIVEDMDELRKGPMTKKARRCYKILAHAACRATAKYPQMKNKIAAALGIGGKVLGHNRIERKQRHPSTNNQRPGHIYWKSEAISREVSLKKRVKNGEPPFLLECSYTEAYRRFCRSHPRVKIGYSMLLHKM